MNAASGPLAHFFIVPDMAGPITGGTLFNRELIAALEARGTIAETCDIAATPTMLERAPERFYWLDSLYLDEFSRLRRLLAPTRRLGVLVHYLPSLVAKGSDITRAELSAGEAVALEHADALLVTSAFMRSVVVRLGARASHVLVVEPGRLAAGVAMPHPRNDRLHAVVVANLTPGKGIDPFLRALRDELSASDQFLLAIVGSDEMDASYARACRDLVATDSRLRFVELTGALAPQSTIALMAASNLMVSASVMEAYGMALAEAKTLGIPIAARRGGNVEHLIDAKAGGELASDHRELARAFVRLSRDPLERGRRLERARLHAWPARPWAAAAGEFIASF